MHDFLAQTIAELKALGIHCLINGPEVWLVLIGLCIFCMGFVCGMFIANLLANRR